VLTETDERAMLTYSCEETSAVDHPDLAARLVLRRSFLHHRHHQQVSDPNRRLHKNNRCTLTHAHIRIQLYKVCWCYKLCEVDSTRKNQCRIQLLTLLRSVKLMNCNIITAQHSRWHNARLSGWHLQNSLPTAAVLNKRLSTFKSRLKIRPFSTAFC